MNEYFKFLIYMAVGLTIVTMFLRKLIDSVLSDWNPAAYCAGQVKSFLREKMDEKEADAYHIRRSYKA